MTTIDKDLDVRDTWLGIRQIKSNYTPQPYHRINTQGSHIHHSNRAQEAANYLKKEQWGKQEQQSTSTEEAQRVIPKGGAVRTESENQFDLKPITVKEIRTTIHKLKRRKAPGPDSIPMEIFKEFDEESLNEVREIMQEWWDNEDIPTDELKARVVLIYKKGNTSKYENYRPISLLNSMYKIFAAIFQKRLARGIDKFIQQTQYGFRKAKSTTDALFLTRRIAEYGEKTTNDVILLLLDWEKAFDKIDREKMHNAMESLGINIKYRNIIKSLYKNTQFKVEIDGVESEWEQQATGIRQGCPLSPYLFILVMTVMFDEIHKELGATLIEKRIPGVTFDEILYADDTICIGTDTKSINKFLKAIEEKGKEFGLKLNQTKCEVVTSMRNPNVHFKDGTRVKIVEEAKYLGCHINEQSDYRKELGKRISIAMITLKKLDIFWLHSNCPASSSYKRQMRSHVQKK